MCGKNSCTSMFEHLRFKNFWTLLVGPTVWGIVASNISQDLDFRAVDYPDPFKWSCHENFGPLEYWSGDPFFMK